MRSRRPRLRELVGCLLHRLLEALAGLGRQPVAEHGAVGVVGLVLQAAREQAVAAELDRLAVEPGAASPSRSRDGRTRRTRPGTTGSPRRPRRGGGRGPRAGSAPGCTPRRRSARRTRPDSRRRRPRGPRRSGTRPGRPRRRRTSSRPCPRPGTRSPSSYAATGSLRRCITSVPQRVIGWMMPPRGSWPCGARTVWSGTRRPYRRRRDGGVTGRTPACVAECVTQSYICVMSLLPNLRPGGRPSRHGWPPPRRAIRSGTSSPASAAWRRPTSWTGSGCASRPSRRSSPSPGAGSAP